MEVEGVLRFGEERKHCLCIVYIIYENTSNGCKVDKEVIMQSVIGQAIIMNLKRGLAYLYRCMLCCKAMGLGPNIPWRYKDP